MASERWLPQNLSQNMPLARYSLASFFHQVLVFNHHLVTLLFKLPLTGVIDLDQSANLLFTDQVKIISIRWILGISLSLEIITIVTTIITITIIIKMWGENSGIVLGGEIAWPRLPSPHPVGLLGLWWHREVIIIIIVIVVIIIVVITIIIIINSPRPSFGFG